MSVTRECHGSGLERAGSICLAGVGSEDRPALDAGDGALKGAPFFMRRYCAERMASPDGIHPCICHAAIANDICATCARRQIFGQADADFLDPALGAGYRHHVAR